MAVAQRQGFRLDSSYSGVYYRSYLPGFVCDRCHSLAAKAAGKKVKSSSRERAEEGLFVKIRMIRIKILAIN